MRFFYFLFFPLISFLCLGRICADSSPLKYRVSSVAFSPDGKQVVSGSWDKSLKVWNAETGTELSTLNVDSEVLSVAFSPSGKTMAVGCYNKKVLIVDVATVAVMRSLSGHSDWWVYFILFFL